MNAFTSKLYKRITNFILTFVVATAALTVVGPYVESASALPPTGTITVQGNTAAGENTEGWMFNRDPSTSTPFEFNADQAVLGLGSLYVQPISGSVASNKFVAENFLMSPIADINTFSFDYKIGAGGVAADYDQIYMNVYANFGSSSPTKFYDCRYTVLATVGSTSNFNTLTFDTDSAYSVATRAGGDPSPYPCPAIPSAMNLLSANSTIRMVAVNVGDTSLGDAGIDAYLDNVVVNSADGVTVYDFEPVVPACNVNSSFDNFSTGSVNGQGGWTSTGPYDQSVVTNTYGISSFGCKSLRLSNAVTSGNFHDQTFSFSAPNYAGETEATTSTFATGVRQNHYEASFDIASVEAALQSGLSVSVSPDRGDGSRMSYLRFEDQVDGIHVFFSEVTGGEDYDFTETDIATLTRSAHTIKFVIDFVDGVSNDVVNISIDGTVVATGTTWEDYYRYAPEQASEQTPRAIDALAFRVGGEAYPTNLSRGYLFDNVSIATSTITESEGTETPPTTGGSGGSTGNGTPTTNAPLLATANNTPAITSPTDVLGETTDNDGATDVEGSSDEKKTDDAKSTNGAIFGLMWYWWILILAGLTGLTWGVIGGIRRNNGNDQ